MVTSVEFLNKSPVVGCIERVGLQACKQNIFRLIGICVRKL